ncbi:hypothetical protein IJI31_04725 [bacterium]|nr:hypothetical protein [bacterium]
MKKLIFLCIFILILCTSCNHKGQIFFYDQPVTNITAMHPVHVFEAGRKIYYLYFNEKQDFKTDFIRVKVIKAYDKTNTGGYSVILTKDYRLMKGEKRYHTDYFVLREPGHYIVQVYAIDNFDQDIGFGELYVR